MLKIPAYLDGFSSRKNRSAGIRFSTQELPAEAFVELQKYNGAFGWLLFDEHDIADDDMPDNLPDDSRKTPSQRLRNVFFVKWKQDGQQGGIVHQDHSRPRGTDDGFTLCGIPRGREAGRRCCRQENHRRKNGRDIGKGDTSGNSDNGNS